MTGFGQAELKAVPGSIRAEIKSTNHKFLEVSVRLPGHLAEFEEVLRKKVSEEVRRGKILLFVSSPDPVTFSSRLVLNEALAKEIFHKIQRLKKILGLNDVSSDGILRQILQTPDVLIKDLSQDRRGSYAKDLLKTVEAALKNFDVSKIFEGRALERDFKLRLLEIKKSLAIIQKRIPLGAKEYRKNLESRMKDFLPAGGGSASGGKNILIDSERLTLEVAMYVKNSDISEEVTRLKSHIDGMQNTLKENGEIGRKVDFIAQEMIREVNTIGSKSSDAAIANSVIAIKSAIEKIREQAQNVE